MEKLRLTISNLSCASCVAGIERVLRAQEGVIWADISFAAKEAAVVYDPIAFRLAGLVRSLARLGLDASVEGRPVKQEMLRAGKLAGRRGHWMWDRSTSDAARAVRAHDRR